MATLTSISDGRDALARVAESGTAAEQAEVRDAVYAKFPGLKKSESTWGGDVELWKSDEHHLVYGVALNPGVRDSQGDRIEESDIRAAAHNYLLESREADIQHGIEKAEGVDLVESAVAPHDMVIGGKPVLKGAWFLAHRITNPDVWDDVQKGALTGYSIGGTGLRLPDAEALEAAVAVGKAEAVEEAVEKASLTNVRVARMSLVDRAAVRDPQNPTQAQEFLLYKNEGATLPTNKEDTVSTTTIDKSALEPAVREALEKAEQERDAAVAKAAAAEAPATEPKEDEVNKADLPAEVRALIEKTETERDAALKKADERIEKAEQTAQHASDLAKAEVDRRVTSEYIAKAETGDLRGLPGEASETGPLMKALAEAAPEPWAAFEKAVLSPASAQLKASDLLKEQGAGGEGPPPESPLAKHDEKVAELMKGDPDMTRTQALERVRRSHPELIRGVHDQIGAGNPRA